MPVAVNMEINSENLQGLGSCLEKTLSPSMDVRKQAEEFLKSSESNKNFGVLLMHFMKMDGILPHIRVSASVCFKNLIKNNWPGVDEDNSKICVEDRNVIKAELLNLMLTMPENVQSQLGESISIISKTDFPAAWQSLLPQMVEKLSSGDFGVINGVLKTAHSMFKEYRYKFRSDDLFREIKYVLDVFADPLTQLFKTTVGLLEQHASNPSTSLVLGDSLVLMSKIFYSLNYQDLPEYFEDHMADWMTNFHKLLNMTNPNLVSNDDETPGVLDNLKSQICHNVALYGQKYDEEFGEYLSKFVESVWNLLVATGSEVKYDYLVSHAIQFLSSVAERPLHNGIFKEQSTLQSICEKVIIPNMSFRDADEELFEDNAEEYIRRDVEGSDAETRRRSACDFVRSLMVWFEGPVSSIFSAYVGAMLQQYAANPGANWKAKDSAIFLVTSLAVKTKTAGKGVTKTNDLVNIAEFFGSHILPDLQPSSQCNIVLKADALKYVMTFRNQLSKENMVQIMPLLINSLSNPNYVVHSYAGMSVEKLLCVKDGKIPRCGQADVKPFLEPLLTGIFNAFTFPGSFENDHLMKAVVRLLMTSKGDVSPYASQVLTKLTDILRAVSKNPSKPKFNHYLFECISASIRFVSQDNAGAIATFESSLLPIFQEILANDVAEFLPYVFQLLAQMLNANTGSVGGYYMEIFRALLTPMLWERNGNIPALVKLLSTYMKKGGESIVKHFDCMTGLLGIFQKLVASRVNDHEGFNLMKAIVLHLPLTAYGPYLKDIFTVCFQRLQRAKTVKFVKGLIIFISLLAGLCEANVPIDAIDSIQPQLFAMVINSLYIAELQKVSDTLDKKICAVGITKILSCDMMLAEPYIALWGPLLNSLIMFFELPEENDNDSDEAKLAKLEESASYQGAYCQLVFGDSGKQDPFASVDDSKKYLAQGVSHVAQAHPGKVQEMAQKSLLPEALAHLQGYLSRAGVSL
eukprot:Nk52_evm8s78 gene=Nk52_evmTU8s78